MCVFYNPLLLDLGYNSQFHSASILTYSYREADLRLCFRLCKKPVISWLISHLLFKSHGALSFDLIDQSKFTPNNIQLSAFKILQLLNLI